MGGTTTRIKVISHSLPLMHLLQKRILHRLTIHLLQKGILHRLTIVTHPEISTHLNLPFLQVQ